MNVNIVDKDTLPGCPTSRFLKKEEIVSHNPDSGLMQSRVNFLFKHKIPLAVDKGYATILIDKYPSIERWAEEIIPPDPKEIDPFPGEELKEVPMTLQQLNEMPYTELKKLDVKKGMLFKDTCIKREELSRKVKEIIDNDLL